MSWIFIAIAAAGFQTLRFMLQKRLSMGTLSAGGATLARFLFSAPFVVTLCLAYVYVIAGGWPEPSLTFFPFALIGALAQILATWCVVALFAERSFAVGITFKKTEVVQTAIVGAVILGDHVTIQGAIAIFLGLLGVLVLSKRPQGDWQIFNRASGLGLLSGLFFAVSAVGYRGATLEIASEDPVMRALFALAFVTLSQTLGLSAWLWRREQGQVQAVVRSWRTSVWMGITGLGGSLCWFTAFTLQNAAYVFAVGQVEVIFSILVSALVFRERTSKAEYLGIGLITLSVMGLVLTL